MSSKILQTKLVVTYKLKTSMFMNRTVYLLSTVILNTKSYTAASCMSNKCNNILSSVSPFLDTNFKVSELLENCSPSGTSPPLCESSLSASPRHRWVRTTCSSWAASEVDSCRRCTNWRCCSRSTATCTDVSGSPTVLVRRPRCSPTYCWATIRAFDDHERSESSGEVCDDTYNPLASDGQESDDVLLFVDKQSDSQHNNNYFIHNIALRMIT